MYGSDAGVTTMALAATGVGLAIGSWFLAGVGLILAGVAIWLLVRRESKTKP
jgi:type IV secretory pathway TrbD component